MNKERKIINVEIPKEIWDAHMSIWNWRRDIMGAWMNSIKDVIKQTQKNEHRHCKTRNTIEEEAIVLGSTAIRLNKRLD